MSEQLEQDIRACLPIEGDYEAGGGYIEASRQELDETVQALVTLIHEREKLWVQQVGQLKIDLHFAYLIPEELREKHSDERVYLHERIENLETELSLDTEGNAVREIITDISENYWVEGKRFEVCFFCGSRFDDRHEDDCVAMRAKNLLKKSEDILHNP